MAKKKATVDYIETDIKNKEQQETASISEEKKEEGKLIDLFSNEAIVINSNEDIGLVDYKTNYVIVKSITTWTNAISQFKLIKKNCSKNCVVIYIEHGNNELIKFVNYMKNNRYNAIQLNEGLFIVQ